jgi:hypothetical protein
MTSQGPPEGENDQAGGRMAGKEEDDQLGGRG